MQVNNDDALAGAILETVRLPILALDATLRVETANDSFLQRFRVTREETVGHLVYDLGNGQWDIPDLRRMLGEILPQRSVVSDYRVEYEFEKIGRRIMHVSARRIERDGHPDLILLAISDDTESEALRAELAGRVELADKLIDSVREGLLILDPDLRVHSASASFYDTFAVDPEETMGHLVYELGNGQWDIPELRQLLEEVLPRQRSFDDFEVTHTFEGIGERVMVLNGRRLDHMDLILLAVRDVTDIRESTKRLKEVAKAAHIGVFEDDRSAGTLYWSPEMRDILGYPQDRPPPPAGEVPEFIHPEDRAAVSKVFADVLDPEKDGAILHEHRIIRPDGEVRWVQMNGQVEFATMDGRRRPMLIRGVILDVTERKRTEEALREREQRLHNVLDGMGEAFGLMDQDLRIITQNTAAQRLEGRSVEEIRGLTHWEAYPGSEDTELGRLYRHALSEQVPVSLEHRFAFPDGRMIWLEMRAYPVPEGLAVFWRDITERKEAEAALRASEERYRSLFDSMDEAYAVVEVIRDRCGRWSDFLFLEVNPAFMEHTSMPFPVGKTATELLGSPNPRWAEIYGRVVETGEALRLEEEEPLLDRIFDLNIFRLGDPDSRRVAVLFTDVTERKRAEQHQTMLMSELDHRVKNILAVVQSIAQQTLGRGRRAGPDAADRLIGRIHALAQSHTLLAGSRWEGARFGDLVECAVAPYRGNRPDRIVVGGPDLNVTPKAAQTLALALHELVTNAAKYGALSSETGSVRAAWHLAGVGDGADSDARGGGRDGAGSTGAGDCLVFSWQEQGGPPIEAPPDRKGFGSRLIESVLAFELDGDVTLEFAPEGLRAVIDLPLDRLRADGRTGSRGRPSAPIQHANATTMQGWKVLVVEDDHLVGQETADALRAAGCSVTGPVGTLAEALRIAVADDLDVAVLDVNLNGEIVWPAARALWARGIPFVFATGYSDMVAPPAELAQAPRIEKPVLPDRLVTTLAAAVTPS